MIEQLRGRKKSLSLIWTVASYMKPRKAIYRGNASEILDPIEFEGYQIQSLRHGNTHHVLYRFPSEAHEWEPCWTMDLQTAKNGVTKYNLRQKESGSEPEWGTYKISDVLTLRARRGTANF